MSNNFKIPSFGDIMQTAIVGLMFWTASNTHEMKVTARGVDVELEHNKIEHIDFAEQDKVLLAKVDCLNIKVVKMQSDVSILEVKLEAIKEDNELKIINENK